MAVPAKTLWILGGAAVAGLVVGSFLSGDDEAPANGFTPVAGTGEWVDAGAPARIGYYADQVAAVTGWGDTLRRYLVAVAYRESRGNSLACFGSCGPGAARGWFQVQPESKCVTNSGVTPEQMRHNERAQVAIAACHAYRLGAFWSEQGQYVQTADVRRGWKFPKWPRASYRGDPDTFVNRDSYYETLLAVGDSSNFMQTPMFPPGFSWPGLDAAMEAVGA